MAITNTEASANRVRSSLYEETTYGVPPASPTLHDIRFTADGLETVEQSVRSNEVLANRRTSKVVRVDFGIDGATLGAELTHPFQSGRSQALEILRKASMFTSSLSSKRSPVAADAVGDVDIVASAGTFDFNADPPGTMPAVGDIMMTTGAAAAGNNNYFVISNVAGNVVTVYNKGGLVDVTAEAGMSVTLLGSTADGTTLCAFGVERHYQNGYTTDPYVRFDGLQVNSWAVDMPVDQICTESFTVLGKAEVARYGSTIGGGYNTRVTHDPITSKIGNQSLWINGTLIEAITTRFEVNNNLRRRSVAGTVGAKSVGEGSSVITGGFSFFAEEGKGDIDKLWVPDTRVDICRVVEDAQGNAQVFFWPQAKLTAMNQPVTGKDTDIIVTGQFEAEEDTATDAMMVYGYHTA